jgi:hypothetical protein
MDGPEPLDDSLGYIDRLERVVTVAPPGLWLHGADLRRLAVPGLNDVLPNRLRDPQRGAAVKDLLRSSNATLLGQTTRAQRRMDPSGSDGVRPHGAYKKQRLSGLLAPSCPPPSF